MIYLHIYLLKNDEKLFSHIQQIRAQSHAACRMHNSANSQHTLLVIRFTGIQTIIDKLIEENPWTLIKVETGNARLSR